MKMRILNTVQQYRAAQTADSDKVQYTIITNDF